jgi:MFS family permease
MIALTTLVAVMLYLDRVCLSIVGEQIRAQQGLSAEQYELLLSAFFWAYALAQLPAGWLGDRYGARAILSLYLFLWSACTGMMGLASGFVSLLILRLGCGLFEAGAYPLAAGIVRRWIPFSSRGMASGIVAVGGRLGGAIAPMLTAMLAVGTADGWRRPFLLYGAVGMIGAVIFWLWYRDRPEDHPSVNPAEAQLIALGVTPSELEPDSGPGNPGRLPTVTPAVADVPEETPGTFAADDASAAPRLPVRIRDEQPDSEPRPLSTEPTPHPLPPILEFLQDRALWLNALVQFLTNVAWVFIITLFPTYLHDVFQTPIEQRALFQSIPLYAGIVGMLFGGWITDRAARRFGLRWGRALPVAGTRALIGVAYVICLGANDPITVTILMAVVAWATDAGNAPIWAYAQDVGGRHVGAVMGWANMFGNLGAAVTPIVFGWVQRSYADPMAGWKAVFLLCACTQVVGALAALGIDASRPIRGTDK